MKIGTGWMQWTEAQTLETSMTVIEDAYAGILDKIRMMTGRGPPPAPSIETPSSRPMTTDLFMTMFGKKGD